MLFGADRVPEVAARDVGHVVVAVGTALSAFWILSANSWMQTPTGFEMRDGIAYPVSWFEIVFNPSFPYRFAHMLVTAYHFPGGAGGGHARYLDWPGGTSRKAARWRAWASACWP